MSATPVLLRPRRHVHRGTVRAAAFWFDPALLGEGEARRRVLAAWTPGAVVQAVGGGYLLRLPRMSVIASDSAPGLVLTLEQGVLSSAPLSASELGHPDVRDGSVVLVRAGRAQVHVLAGTRAVDLSEWLDVSAWETVSVRGLGAPPPPVPALEPLPPPTRALFGPAVPTLAPEAQVMLARMQGRPPPEGLVVEVQRPGLLARLRAALFGGGEARTGAVAGERSVRLLARLRAALFGGGEARTGAVAGERSAGWLARLRAAMSGRGDAAQAGASGVVRRPGLLARLRAAFGSGTASGDAARPGALSVVRRPGLLARLRAAFSSRTVSGDAAQQGTAKGPGLLARLRAAFGSGTASGDAAQPGLLAGLRAAFSSRTASGNTMQSGAASIPRGPSLLARLLAAFGTGTRMAQAGAPGAGSGSATYRPGLLSRFAAWLLRGGTERSLPSGSPGAASSGPRGTAPSGPPPGPSLLSRFSEWMLMNTPLGELLGRRKAEYVRRLFDLFDEGNLQEALRYAIPLGSGGPDENTRIALGLPGPRESLSIQPSRGGAISVFAGGDALYAALKERYREAFRRFEREGRIDEAAFILAELLGAHEEAVSFLERHGRFKLAAELAEGRNLAPGLVVRQWFLAKDVARATAIARRSGAFADAVLRLERSHPDEARVLRLLWGETLAQSGDWSRAVQAVWPIPDARTLARGWMERGVACGGANGARLLALWATAFPETFTAALAHVRELLDDDAPERAAERYTFALTLAGESSSPGRTALLVPTLRALLRDRAAGRARFTPDFLSRLLRDAPDGTLRADLPPVSERPHAAWSTDASRPPVHLTVRETDAGAFPVHDAVALPDGRMLLALGEAGARLLRADGRPVAHFDVPAFSLVPSVHGDRALALAPRGDTQRLSRLDLVARKATPWCDAEVSAWAPTYDGNAWFVSTPGTVMMVDALAPGLRALWRVSEVPGGAVALLAVDAGRLSFLTRTGERWTYDLPQGPTLRARTPLPGEVAPHVENLGQGSLTADGEVVVIDPFAVMEAALPRASISPDVPVRVRRGPSTFWLKPTGTRSALPPEQQRAGLERLFLSETWRVELLRCSGHFQLHLTDARGTERALLVFEGGTAPRVRLTATALVAFDPTGRVLCLDLEEGIARHVPVR